MDSLELEFGQGHETSSLRTRLSARVIDKPSSRSEHFETLLRMPHSENVFFEEWMIDAANRYLEVPYQPLITFQEEFPTGFFPIHFRKRTGLTPFSIPMLYHHEHCFSSKPIIREGFEQTALRAFLRWLDRNSFAPVLRIEYLPKNGPVTEALLSLCKEESREALILKQFGRAAIQFPLESASFLETLSKKQRKEIRRKQRRLEEHGEVHVEQLVEKEALPTWIHEYHRLELTGWKGQAGTAISQSVAESHFFQSVLEQALEQNRLFALRLCVNGKAVAHRISFLSGSEVFSYKTVYDERYANCSPGLLLEVENLNRLAKNSSVDSIDFCSEANHPLFDRLTKERKEFLHLFISLKKPFAKGSLQLFGKLRQKVRQ